MSRRAPLLLLALAAVHCSAGIAPNAGGAPDASSTTDAPSPDSAPSCPPLAHRAQSKACPLTVVPIDAGLPDAGPDASAPPHNLAGPCFSDRDCNMLFPARCVETANGGQCDYDQCAVDQDCGSSGVCSCMGETRGWAGQSPGNICVPSNCRVDGDCASGVCSPTFDVGRGPFYGVAGYYCHSAADECTSDADCGGSCSGAFGSVVPYCGWQPAVGHWVCASVTSSG